MNRAIAVLGKRISDLNKEMDKVQKSLDEPELLSEYHFASNDMANLELEVLEIQEAINILIKTNRL